MAGDVRRRHRVLRPRLHNRALHKSAVDSSRRLAVAALDSTRTGAGCHWVDDFRDVHDCTSFSRRCADARDCAGSIRNPDLAPYQPGHPGVAGRRSLYAGDALTPRESTLAHERAMYKKTPAEADSPAGVPAIRLRIVWLH